MNKIFLILIFLHLSLLAKDTNIIKFINNNSDVMLLINPSNGKIVKANQSDLSTLYRRQNFQFN